MTTPNPGRQDKLRELIAGFLQERLAEKHDKVSPDDPKHAELRQRFHPPTWLADAARRVSQLQAVTHSHKPLPPGANGTNLLVDPGKLVSLNLVGTHCLGDEFDLDVVGDAKLLPIFGFLQQSFQGQTLLALCEARDPDLAVALGTDRATAAAWMSAFAGLRLARSKVASHSHAKQVFWPVDDNWHDDQAFHLLAPMYPTSLVHRLYSMIQDFSEATMAARSAKKGRTYSDLPVYEYTDLAIQQLGGTKPQNISQLNSERRGNNLLLASLPPSWRSLEIWPLLGQDSMFERFGKRKPVREPAKQLRRFLETGPPNNFQTRTQVDDWIDPLIDELLFFTAELRTLPPGWSQVRECQLSAAQRHWLDPWAPPVEDQAKPDARDTEDTIAGQFANWLNGHLRGQLRDPLPVGDSERAEWKKRALDQIRSDDWELRDDE